MAKSQDYLVTGESQKVIRYDRTYNLVHGETVSIKDADDAQVLIDAQLITDDWEDVEEEDQPQQYVDPSTGAFIDNEADPDSNSYTDPPKEA